MSELDRRYPLHWPAGWKRTPTNRRERSRYKVSDNRALQDLLHSLDLLGAYKVILSSNLMLTKSGLPYANQRTPEDVGIAVYFLRDGEEQVLACDRWLTAGENMRAIGQAVDSLRQLQRCGASEILNRAFTGFAALPAQASAINWREELGLGTTAGMPTAVLIEQAYKFKARTAHPDAGGSTDAFIRLTQARDAALLEIRH